MTSTLNTVETRAQRMGRRLVAAGFTSFVAVPCGVLAPLLDELAGSGPGLRYVPREDTALGVAVGQRLAGGRPLVLMQNSGLGQSINALASLVLPYRLGIGLIVSIRGIAPDHTAENAAMGAVTVDVLRGLDVMTHTLGDEPDRDEVGWLWGASAHDAAALLVRPDSFGWQASA